MSEIVGILSSGAETGKKGLTAFSSSSDTIKIIVYVLIAFIVYKLYIIYSNPVKAAADAVSTTIKNVADVVHDAGSTYLDPWEEYLRQSGDPTEIKRYEETSPIVKGLIATGEYVANVGELITGKDTINPYEAGQLTAQGVYSVLKKCDPAMAEEFSEMNGLQRTIFLTKFPYIYTKCYVMGLL